MRPTYRCLCSTKKLSVETSKLEPGKLETSKLESGKLKQVSKCFSVAAAEPRVAAPPETQWARHQGGNFFVTTLLFAPDQ